MSATVSRAEFVRVDYFEIVKIILRLHIYPDIHNSIMDIQNSIMYIHNWIMYIHNSIVNIHNSILDIHN